MEPQIQPMDPNDPQIHRPQTRLPSNNDPADPFDLDKNYTTADKDFRKFSLTSPFDVNRIHTRSDSDSGPNAQHHTLGFNRNQASPGDHIHDGGMSKKLGTGLNLVVTGSKGGNAALASLLAMLQNVISFTDNTT